MAGAWLTPRPRRNRPPLISARWAAVTATSVGYLRHGSSGLVEGTVPLDRTALVPSDRVSGARIQVESKDDIKKRLGRSTDDGDAVVMAYSRSGGSWASLYAAKSDEPEDEDGASDVRLVVLAGGGGRLDRELASATPELSRARIQALEIRTRSRR